MDGGVFEKQLSVIGIDAEEWQTRKAFVDFSEEDARLLKELHAVISKNADSIVDGFYQNIESYPELMQIVERNGSNIDRLKIASRLSEQRPAGRAPLNACIQVNLDDESSKAGIDLAVITDESSIAYLAGFWGYLSVEFGRPTFLLVSPNPAH